MPRRRHGGGQGPAAGGPVSRAASAVVVTADPGPSLARAGVPVFKSFGPEFRTNGGPPAFFSQTLPTAAWVGGAVPMYAIRVAPHSEPYSERMIQSALLNKKIK